MNGRATCSILVNLCFVADISSEFINVWLPLLQFVVLQTEYTQNYKALTQCLTDNFSTKNCKTSSPYNMHPLPKGMFFILQLWTLTLTFELDLYRIKINPHATRRSQTPTLPLPALPGQLMWSVTNHNTCEWTLIKKYAKQHQQPKLIFGLQLQDHVTSVLQQLHWLPRSTIAFNTNCVC